MRIPIVFSTDHNYVMPTCVTIHSLLFTADKDTNFDINVIIDSNVNEEDKEKMRREVEPFGDRSRISFVEIGNTFSDGFEIRDISKACYNRLLIPWLLPQYDKVIYSDVDIIFKGDISSAYNIEAGDNLVFGVGSEVWKKGLIFKYLKKINLDPEEYINSGFILINSKLQREQNLKDRYLELSKHKFLYQDQDIINIVCKGKIGHLPYKFNVKPIDYKTITSGDTKVIHFFGLKPWNYFTYSWMEWWETYKTSRIFDPAYNFEVSKKILKLTTEIKKVRKIGNQKYKFVMGYLTFRKPW